MTVTIAFIVAVCAVVATAAALLFLTLWLRAHATVTALRQDARRLTEAQVAFLERTDTEARLRIRRLQNLLADASSLGLTPQQKRQFQGIRRQAEDNNRFFFDVIEFSQLRMNAFSDIDETFDLEGLTTEVVRSFVSHLRSEDVEIVIQVRDSANQIFAGQKRHFSTLLAHLVEYAVTTLQKGEITISFAGRDLSDGKREITLSVADNGPGIPPDALPHVFEPFAQRDTAPSSRRNQSSGLGLSLAKQCARSLGGELNVVSVEHQGTTFTARVTLTLAQQPQPEPVLPSDLLRQQLNRVLIVDDSHGNARYLREIFESWKIPVHAYTSGRDCLQFLRAQETAIEETVFDLLLLDDSIEDFDYVSLMHYLQTRRGLVRKVVLMAPLTEVSSSSARMREPGIDGHIFKPIRRRELLRVLEFAGSAPLHEVTRESMPEAPREVAARPAWEASSHKVRCLVVEDNLVNMHTVTELLRLKNYEFLVAENGREAVAMYTQNASQLDIVLMDVQMPEMDGFEATRRIRQLEEERSLGRTPILALTAFSLEEEREKCIEAGMDDFLAKPIHVDDLFEKIERWTSQSRRDLSPSEEAVAHPDLRC